MAVERLRSVIMLRALLASVFRMRRLLLVIVLMALSVSYVRTQDTRTRIDVSKLGPQVGERVPDFQLNDQAGRSQTLESIMGLRGAMLVFVRSADW
jgi:hypothetical protein